MAATEKEYRRLPGKGRPPFPRSFIAGGLTRLYLAPDHLLKVEKTYWMERYRRFYLKDIQVIQITRTANNLIGSWVLGTILAGLAAGVYFTAAEARVTFAVVAAVVAVIFLLQLLRGASCTTLIRTASSTETIYSLQQLRKAQKVADQLTPLLRKWQGGEDPSALVAALSALPSPPPVPTFTALRPPLPAWHRWLAWGMGGTLVLLALSSLALLFHPSRWGFPVSLGFTMVALLLNILVMIRPVPGCGRALAGTVLGFFVIYGATLYGLMIRLIVTNPALARDQDALHSALFALGMKQDFFIVGMLYGVAATAGILGLIVLLRLLTVRRA